MLMLVTNGSLAETKSQILLLVCHAQSRILLRQQDLMGKHLSIIIYVINFENTVLLACFFIVFKWETHP